MKRLLEDITALAWTLAGTGLVLITLTGSTRKLGMIIAGIGLAINLVGLLAKMSKDSE
jgi:hypothetical protein